MPELIPQHWLCPVLPPLAHFSECGVILNSRGGRSASPLIEEGLKRQSSEFLSCFTCVLFKERPEGPETVESLGPRGFLIIRVNPPRLYPSTTEQTWHKSRITAINTEVSSQGTARSRAFSHTNLIRYSIFLCSLIQANA